MSPDQVELVDAVLRQSGTISSLPGAEVESKDIVRLRPSQWLNDEIMTFYGVMINNRSAAAAARRKAGKAIEGDEDLLDVHVFSSFFFEKISKIGYSAVKRWTKKFDLFQKDIILMPINLGNAHWVCAAINIAKKRFEYYDSMGRINYGVLQVREALKPERQCMLTSLTGIAEIR